MKTHLHSLDTLRGLAALMVCIFHFTNGNSSFLPDTSLLKHIGSYGHLGVEIFFVISGIVIPYAMHRGRYNLSKFRTFFFKRCIRIEPPYLVSIVLASILGFISTLSPLYRGDPFTVDVKGLFYHLGYINAFTGDPWIIPVYWTLAIEFQYYLLIALLFPLIVSPKPHYWLSALLIFALSGFVADVFIFQYALFFSLGILSYKYLVGAIGKTYFLTVCLLLVGLILYKFSLPAIIASLVPVIGTLFFPNQSRAGDFLGRISFSLYLTHTLIGGRVVNLSMNFIDSPLGKLAVVCLATLASIGFAYLFYRFIELPAKKLAGKISYSPTALKVPA